MDTSRGIIAALAIGVVAFAIDYSLGEQALFSPGASPLHWSSVLSQQSGFRMLNLAENG